MKDFNLMAIASINFKKVEFFLCCIIHFYRAFSMKHDVALAPQEFLIVIAFLWFSYQCGVFRRGERSRAEYAWSALISVFVLCAFNGYAVPAIGALFNISGSWIRSVHYWGHWLLVAAAWLLALSAAPQVIARALERDARLRRDRDG